MTITKIISGGQTGADRGGLEAAIYCELPYGGWCPKGKKAKDGKIPDKYQLNEMNSGDYLKRTEANVVDSDATIVFTERRPTGGSLRTIQFCMKHGKPWHQVSLSTTPRKTIIEETVKWLEGDCELNDYEDYEAKPPDSCVLNVAGSRESKCPGIQEAVQAVLIEIISKANGKCFYPLPKSKAWIVR